MPCREPQQNCARELVPLLAWICGIAVALALRYGCYGDEQMALGPNSSRMVKASSVFVEEVRVEDEKQKGMLLYGFVKPPELSVDRNWTILKHLFVDSYSHEGVSLWLNEGSMIWMEWEVVPHDSGNYKDVLMVVLKGEQNVKELQRFHRMFSFSVSDLADGTRKAEYRIIEDNSYYIGILNLSPRHMVTKLKIDVSSKMYDTSEAASICSTDNGICKFKLSFPVTQYLVLTTPNSDVPTTGWKVQFSFVARHVSYFILVGCLVVGIYLVLYCLGACGSYQEVEQPRSQAEIEPIITQKETSCTYRTNEEDPSSSLSCSSEDLHDKKICAICYEDIRDCFFTPCGHNISCYTCAQRIVKENKVCPICRRIIHKVRRLSIYSR